MTHYYDTYGWLTSQPIEGRSTEATPLQESGNLRNNWTGLEWVLVEYTEPPAPTPAPVAATPWTKKEFLLKFTPAEYAAIKAAALVSAELDYYWTLFNIAEDVLKTDPVTIAGINLLEQAGLIAPGRAAEILA